ncbi:MAG: PTS sugar transporter subunit IIC [[Eubacterium] rectale]|nr:PTS sugar transporter subunit IIC [Agathobacter rectalis]
MKEKFNEKVIPVILKFINTKAIQSIKNGMVTSMSPLIIGSIFLILSNFPVKAVVDVLESTGIKPVLDQVCGATFSISALIAVIGISYSYAKLENQEPLNCGIISLATFLILMPSSITTEGGEVVSGIINKTWTAGQGMIGAIIVGLIVPPIYCWFLKKNIRIKMPAGVPEGVTEIIYKVVQTPLQKMTDSLGGAVLMCFTGPFLWFFGVHGSTVVGGIMTGLLQANSLANQAIIDSGVELTIANGGHIVTQQFYDQFINITGAGITIGLVMYMFFFAKSKQLKALGKLGIIPALFGINEPILFGAPVVMNPMLAIPFIGMPVIACLIQYFALYTGQIPWTCPPIISGFLLAGWKSALLQLVILCVSFFVYLPFIKKIDKMNLVQEKNQPVEDEDEDW